MKGAPAQPLPRADRSLSPFHRPRGEAEPSTTQKSRVLVARAGLQSAGPRQGSSPGQGWGVGIPERPVAPAPPAPCRAACLVHPSTSSGSRRRSVAPSLPGMVPGDFTYRETLLSRVWTVCGRALPGTGQTPELVATELSPSPQGVRRRQQVGPRSRQGPAAGPLQRRSGPRWSRAEKPETASQGVNTPDPLPALWTPEAKGSGAHRHPATRGEPGWPDGGRTLGEH